MAHLSLSFLGPFRVALDGEPLTGFKSNPVRALLAYLAVEAERPHPREMLAGLLWPDWPDRSALSNLRHVLSSLRRIIGDPQPPIQSGASLFLLISREAVQFNAESDHDLDVRTFGELLAGQGGEQPSMERLERALALYRGSFLEGLSVADSPTFEEWATLRREQLAQQLLTALERLAAGHEQRGECAQAEKYARQQLEVDPLREEAHRQFMRALALGGQRSAALAQYQTCRRLLSRELGVEPEQETTALYERIRQEATVGVGPAALPELPLVPEVTIPEPVEAPEAPRPLFVAREEELAQLERWLGMALAGLGRVGFVVGEPGSGKTLLLQEFTRRAMESRADLVVASGNCNAYSGLGDPYLPFLEILGMLTADIEARCAVGGIGREHARRLRALFPTAVQALLDSGPGLVDLLLPGAALLARAQVLAAGSAPWRRRLEEVMLRRGAGGGSARPSQIDLFQQVTRVLQAIARERPLLLVLDDLQWADAGSISLLFHLGRRLVGYPLLIVGAYRPEEVAAGREGQRHPLEPVVHEFERTWGDVCLDLSRTERRRFVEALLDSEPNHLGPAFREALYRHTGGHALFTVELLRGLQERGDLRRDESGLWVEGPSLDWEQLPTRVEAVIVESIGRLPREWQELLAVASVEGEEFTAEVLARVRGMEEREVLRCLNGGLSQEHRLVAAQSVLRLGGGRLSRYRFRHFLFQHYLHQGLNAVERAHLHEEVGSALEALYGAVPGPALASSSAAATPLQLARHFQEAGLTSKAAAYLQQAALADMSRWAWPEAVAHSAACVQLLQTLPQSPERLRAELLAQFCLASFTVGARGWTALESGRAYERAHELAQQVGEESWLFRVQIGLGHSYLFRGKIQRARQLQEPWLNRREPEFRAPQIAFTLLVCGDFAAAREYLERVPPPEEVGEPSIDTAQLMAYLLWYLGYPDQSLRMAVVALALAHKSEWPDIYMCWVLSETGTILPQLRRDVRAAQEGVAAALRVAEHATSFFERADTILQGWVVAQSGRAVEGIARMRQGLAAYRSSGEELRRPHWLALLAEGYALAGRTEEGLGAIAEALEHVERTDERYYEAEVHRLKGELLRQRAREQGGKMQDAGETSPCFLPPASCILPPSPEACFQKAIEVARRQEARSWELRATMSLCRLWQSEGKIKEAREALAAIYGWFTEGFDTPDLQGAKALLEELGAGEGESTGQE